MYRYILTVHAVNLTHIYTGMIAYPDEDLATCIVVPG
jgi:hypothetical protein